MPPWITWTARTGSATAAVLALSWAAASPAPVAAASWDGLGPDGGDVFALEASPLRPGLVFAGLGNGGLYRSTDCGETWEPARDGLLGAGAVFDVAADPVDPDTVYAGTSDGVYATRDGGVTWSRASEGFPGFRHFLVEALAASPSAPGTLYAGTLRGVWKSTDGARTWRPARGGLPSGAEVTVVAVHPGDASIVYAGVDGTGLYKSTDGGATWALSDDGFGRGRFHIWPNDLAFDPSDPSTLYGAAREHGSRLYKSTDGGATWRAVGPKLVTATNRRPPDTVVVLPRSPQTILVGGPWGLFRSEDGGESWDRPGGRLQRRHVQTLEADPFAAATVFAGTFVAGVLRSEDGGEAWRVASRGLTARPLGLWDAPIDEPVHGLVVDPRGDGHLYAIGEDGTLYGSDDRGASWTRFEDELEGGRVRDFRLDPSRPSILHARVLLGPGGGEPRRELLFRSTDSGRSWLRVGAGLPAVGRPPHETHGALHWDPRSPGALYLRIGETAFWSTDDAASWSVLYERLPGPLGSYAPTPRGRTLFAWDRVLGEPPCVGLGCPGPPLVTVFFKSSDGGRTWIELDTQDEELAALAGPVAIDPDDPSVLYGLRGGDLVRSTDGGVTFRRYLRTPFEPLGSRPEEGRAASVVADPRRPGVRYRATALHGVERSTDGGRTWHAFGEGLGTTWVHGVVLLPRGPRVLYAATRAGVWALALGDDRCPPPGIGPGGRGLTDRCRGPRCRAPSRTAPPGGCGRSCSPRSACR